MSQLRNIFALIISHFYGIMDRNWDFPLLGLGVYKATAPGEVEGAIATAGSWLSVN